MRYYFLGLGFKGHRSTELVATCVDVLCLDHSREVEFHAIAKVLCVGHAQLPLVIHLGL